MLSLRQLQLIRCIEIYDKSPFKGLLVKPDGIEKPFYIISDEEYIIWLSIPFSHVRHLAHIDVCVLYPDNFKESEIIGAFEDYVSGGVCNTPTLGR